MRDLLDIEPQALAHVHIALRAAATVRQRSDIFLWSQGPVQACLPHTLMACALWGPGGNTLHRDCFHGTLIDAHVLEEVMAPQTGLLSELSQHCLQGGGAPFWINGPTGPQPVPRPARSEEASFDQLSQRCARLDLGPALVVSTGALPGSRSSCFVFFKVALPTAVPPAELATLLLPHFHLGLCRSWAAEAESVGPKPQERLTKRQAQIMNWVQQGKTNFEIAVILEVSPLTVKNHLQKLFKRLDVHNRAQAVAKRMAGT
jgi:transcriptional regulator EpsA